MSHFEHIQVQTTQNVKLQYEVSAIGDRLLAYIIDYMIMLGMSALIALVYYRVFGFDTQTTLIIGIVAIILPLAFYHLLLEVFNDGQSIGKKLMKIRVIRLDGTEPTLGNYAIRWLTRIIEMQGIFGLGLIVVLVNGRGQRIGDLAGGTTVAKVKKRVSLSDTILSFSTENHMPLYPMAKTLSGRDVEVIKEAILFFERYGNYEVLDACGIKVKNLFGMDPYKDGQQNHIFLKHVVNDYTYFKSLDGTEA